MVKAKTNQELTKMRKAGIIVALAHRAASAAMQPGITTQELDRIIENVILENGATPSFKGLYGFPAAACIMRRRHCFSRYRCLLSGVPWRLCLDLWRWQAQRGRSATDACQ